MTQIDIPKGAAAGRRRLDRQQINLAWFVKLRWTAIVGQLATIFIVRYPMDIDVPLGPLLAIVGVAAATNVALEAWLRSRSPSGSLSARRRESALVALMLLDDLLLTSLLYYAGGTANPFTVFYLVNVALAAAILGARWAWALNGAAFACYTLLFFAHVPLEELEHGPEHEHAMHHHTRTAPGPMSLHLQGSLIAFGGAGAFIVYFVTRVTGELARREAELDEASERRARAEKLEALATLAAGAAHELASPLSTIAVLSRDWELALESGAWNESDGIKDVRLIRSEAARCRKILDSMATGAGQSVGEEWVRVSVDEVMRAAVSTLTEAQRVDLTVEPDLAGRRFTAPRQAIAEALRAIVHNGLQAAPAPGRVRVVGRRQENDWIVSVVDHGCGMSPEVLRRVGEPFFTTKEPGAGMGLGMFLARRVIERLGGSLTLESEPGFETTVVVRIPLDGGLADSPRPESPPATAAPADAIARSR